MFTTVLTKLWHGYRGIAVPSPGRPPPPSVAEIDNMLKGHTLFASESTVNGGLAWDAMLQVLSLRLRANLILASQGTLTSIRLPIPLGIAAANASHRQVPIAPNISISIEQSPGVKHRGAYTYNGRQSCNSIISSCLRSKP